MSSTRVVEPCLDIEMLGVDPALLYPFSSAGGTPILFDIAGNRLSTPEIRQKPEIVAPTGTNNTFFGDDIAFDPDAFPNFFGTSASASHAAAVAALMLEAGPALSTSGIYLILEKTADNIDPAGFDFDGGFGFIQADLAVQIATNPICKGFAATIFGDADDNILNGTASNDVMHGLGGSDNMDGAGGNDIMCGGSGDDTMNGGTGKDRMFGQGGADNMMGGAGRDKLNGGASNDTMNGGNNNDNCNGGPANGDGASSCETVANVP